MTTSRFLLFEYLLPFPALVVDSLAVGPDRWHGHSAFAGWQHPQPQRRKPRRWVCTSRRGHCHEREVRRRDWLVHPRIDGRPEARPICEQRLSGLRLQCLSVWHDELAIEQRVQWVITHAAKHGETVVRLEEERKLIRYCEPR